jgi:hypothetical protein
VKVERLKSAAELLVLRHDTLRIIDGAEPGIESPPSESTEQGDGSEMETECVDQVSQALSVRTARTTSRDVAGDSARSTKATKCTFSGMVVPIELQRFQESSTRLVECPDCGAMRTLETHGGVLRFKSHGRRKTTTPNTGQRGARGKTDWDVVNG